MVFLVMIPAFQNFYSKFGKAELLLLKFIHLFAREVFLVKKLEIEETKTTYTVNI
jgi:hypothetical protein